MLLCSEFLGCGADLWAEVFGVVWLRVEGLEILNVWVEDEGPKVHVRSLPRCRTRAKPKPLGPQSRHLWF